MDSRPVLYGLSKKHLALDLQYLGTILLQQWHLQRRTEVCLYLYLYFLKWCRWLLLSLLSPPVSPSAAGPMLVFQVRESRVDFWVNSSSWHWFLCLAAKEVVLFVTGIKACNCSAVVAEREFICSGDESSPTAVLSGCSFQPLRKKAHTAFCHQRWGVNLSLALQTNP